jgi:hypothetical protein
MLVNSSSSRRIFLHRIHPLTTTFPSIHDGLAVAQTDTESNNVRPATFTQPISTPGTPGLARPLLLPLL